MVHLGQQVFVSYRGDYYSFAEALSQWLVQNNYCANVILFPPNSLSARGEILLPYEYIELMEFILDRLARSDAFVFLNTDDYQDSYFTQAELLQWRRFRDDPIVYPVGGSNTFQLGEGLRLETLTKNEKKLWAGISVGVARSYRSKFNPGFAAAKYAKNCFMIPCRKCGQHFVASQKAVYSTLKGQFQIFCPHCSNGQFHFKEGTERGTFYRKPIILEQPYKNRLRILESQEILSLLVNNELPDSIGLVTLDSEKLSSDLAKVGKAYLGLGALALGAIGLAALFGNSDEDED